MKRLSRMHSIQRSHMLLLLTLGLSIISSPSLSLHEQRHLFEVRFIKAGKERCHE